MRKKIFLRPYLQLVTVLLILMSVPKSSAMRLKAMTISILAPVWEFTEKWKKNINYESHEKDTSDGAVIASKEEQLRLEIENHLLKNEIQHLREVLQNERLIQTQCHAIDDLEKKDSIAQLMQLRKKNFSLLLQQQLLSVPAQVLFRSVSNWTHCLWINVGNETNSSLGREVIALNSPVVIGTFVVGMIDYVGTKQSRVRLITDSRLTPSVRVVRHINGEAIYLAKGELRGSHESLGRSVSSTLIGINFNYDYPDQTGPARDLRTGEPIEGSRTEKTFPIIEVGDLLITTGLDGVFPFGLRVATVSQIGLLKEGDYAYEIEAKPCIESLDDLSTLFVLPPTGYQLM